MPKFDFKELLLAFDKDQQTTIQEIEKSIQEMQLKEVEAKLRPTSGTRTNLQRLVPSNRVMTTKKLFEQTIANLQKSIEIEKKAKTVQENHSKLEIAKLMKIQAD